MSIKDLYTPSFKNRNCSHFASIVKIALADDIITEEEKAFIDRLAIYLEIEPEMADKIMESPEDYKISPPSDEKSRLERLYDIGRMVHADYIADEQEKILMKRMVVGLGFEIESVESLVNNALDLIEEGLDQDEFVERFNV